MVDVLRISEARGYSRFPFDADRPNAPSRRSSISSRAESEASVFSDTSIASSQSSASLNALSGWESSTQYDSDEDNLLSNLIDSSESESAATSGDESRTGLKFTNRQTVSKRAGPVDDNTSLESTSRPHPQPSKNQPNNGPLRCPLASTVPQPTSQPVTGKKSDDCFVRPLHPSRTWHDGQRSKATHSHPRRTATDPSWAKPSLVTQDERRLNFVENLVDTATDLVALIWPTSVAPVFPDGQRSGTPVISLRFFIRETLRRSRTSFSTLQVAMYYLALLNFSGNLPKCDFTKEQRPANVAGRALQCGRRMFLASLILASKYLQDRNYFTKAWSRISNLPVAEINRNEMALLGALDYKLHINASDFQRWTDCVSKCTTAVQQGFGCPWVPSLESMGLWRGPAASIPVTNLRAQLEPLAKNGTNTIDGVAGIGCPMRVRPSLQHQSTTIAPHRLSLAHAGQTIAPTRPMCASARAAMAACGDRPWPGMASHLASMVEARCPVSRFSQGSSGLAANNATTPLSPPKTPSPVARELDSREEQGTIDSLMGGEEDVSQQRPPPAPREPLVSLNTTPESNDGASTFGNYLSPMANDSTQPPSSGNPRATQASFQPSAARYQADTLGNEENSSASEDEVPELTSPSSSPSAGSFDLPSPTLKNMELSPAIKVADLHNPDLDAFEHDASENEVTVLDDPKRAIGNANLEAETRRLTRKETKKTAGKNTPAADVNTSAETIIAIPAEDSKSGAGGKRCCSWKQQQPCHRRKRGASSSFNGTLPVRTKKAMRV